MASAIKGGISIQLDNITIRQHCNTEPVEVNGTNQTKWLNSLKIPVTSQTKISLGARHPTVHVAQYMDKPAHESNTTPLIGVDEDKSG